MSSRCIFFLTNKKLGSSYLMGGVLSKYCDGICIDSGDWESLRSITNSYIVLVKKLIGYYDPNVIQHLRKQNNKIIYIVTDAFSVNQKGFKNIISQYRDLYDLVLFPSEHASNVFRNIVNSKVLYHLWDPQVTPTLVDKFKICYFGFLRPDKIHMLDHIDHIDSSSKAPGCSNFYNDLSKYTCHYSVRDSECSEYMYGTNTKLSTAAAAHCNIVCSRDRSFIELLSEYDYYVDSIEETPEMIDRAKKEYNSKKWRDNLNRLLTVKDRTSPEKIGMRLRSFVNEF